MKMDSELRGSMKSIWTQFHGLPSSLPARGESFPALNRLPLISKAVDEAENNIKAPKAIIFNAALTALAVALQGLVDVRKPSGQCVPTSLMLLAVANSGERKSTAENVFIGPIREFQSSRKAAQKYSQAKWQAEYEIWELKKKTLQKKFEKKIALELSGDDESKALLSHEELRPKRPVDLKFIYEDATSEALFYGLYNSSPTAGLISSEGGGILGGRAFNDLSKQNAIWSGDSITVDRKTADSFDLVGARLTVSIMAQESAVRDYLERCGEKARGSGLWARFLVCHPQTTQGSRLVLNATQSWEHKESFSKRLVELMIENVKFVEADGNEKKLIQFSSEAVERWVQIANEIELEIKPGGRFFEAGDHASKLADNIARVAALFHCFEEFQGDISLETLNDAIRVCFWYSDEFLRLFVPPPQEQVDALLLNEWLNRIRERGERFVRKNHVLQYCPGSIRKKDRLGRALEVLEGYGFVSMLVDGRIGYLDLHPSWPREGQVTSFLMRHCLV